MRVFNGKLIFSVLLMISVIGSAQANTVLYEISGDVVGQPLQVAGDPIADLLNIPRNALSTIPFKLAVTIDTGSTPFVIGDNSIGQEVNYSEAIINVGLDLNGIQFQTLQPLQRVTIQGSGITIVNTVANPGQDVFKIQTNELFNSFDDVFLSNILVVVSAAQLFDGIEIPTDSSVFDSLPLAIGIQLGTNAGGFAGFSNGTGSIVSFNITPVPVPPAILLFLSGMGLLRLKKLQRSK